MNQELGGVAGLHLRSVFCIPFNNLQREVYGYGLMISAFIGLLGAIFQLVLWKSYLRNHDIRHKPSSNPHIVFNLALSNGLACLASSIFGLALLLSHHPCENGMISRSISSHDIYWTYPVEVLCDFGYMASSIWTFMYLLDVCFQVHKINCRVAFYYLLCWGLAACFTALIEVFKFAEKSGIRKCSSSKDVLAIVIIWVSSIFILMLLSSIILYLIDHQVKIDIYFACNTYTSSQRSLMRRVRAKFIVFLVIFFICWLPTLAVGILHLASYASRTQEGLSIAEAILHPLQGVFNYFIFTPLRTGQSPQAYSSDRRSPILTRGTIHQYFATSCESSLSNSLARVPIMQSVSSFHFTPCFQDFENSLLRSYRSSDTLDNFDGSSLEHTLKIGRLLGEDGALYR